MNLINPEEQKENGLSSESTEETLQNNSDQEHSEETDDSSKTGEITEEGNNFAVPNEISFAEILSERDEFLNLLQSVKAEFDNYQKQTKKRISETRTFARGEIVEKLLPVLDACDAAVLHGAEDVVAIRKALIDSLENEGLKLVGAVSEKFDPSIHEAVSHEPGNEDEEEQVVSEVLRQGYFWEGKILRPAMVKVRG
ncbi:MAG: nucleotide exchange factor GrpE [Acidimicrobiales bacterium]|nr:nucleotide exchange factor GrpE [Acidimicrobiales bacterium]